MAGKKRIVRLHRAVSLTVAIVVTLVLAVVIFLKSGLLSNRISRHVNDHYLRGTDFRFSCGNISGDLVGHISIDNPVLRYSGDGRQYEVFRARKIELDYDLLKTIKLEMIVSNLELSDVHVRIRENEEGAPIVPFLEQLTTANREKSGFSPHIDVHALTIRNLDVELERGGQRHDLRDIDLVGSVEYLDGTAEVRVASGAARHVQSDLRVGGLELVASAGPHGIAVSNMKLRMARSYIIASGRFSEGEFRDVHTAFNPLALSEVAALGLINPKDGDGEIGGNLAAWGPPDSLSLEATVTGKAIGLAFSGMSLAGYLTPDELRLTRAEGALYGSRVSGDVVYDRRDGSYSFTGVCEGLDITDGLIKDEGVPETNLNGFVKLDYIAPQKAYLVQGDLRRSSISGFEAETVQARLSWRSASGLRIRSVKFARPGFVLDASGTIDLDNEADFILALEGDDVDYLMDYVELPHVGGSFDVSGRLTGHLDRLQLNLNGTARNLEYLDCSVDSAFVQAEARNIRSDDVTARLDVSGDRIAVLGRRFTEPHVLLEANAGVIHVRDFSFSRGDTLITTDFDVVPSEGDVVPITVKHAIVRMPSGTWLTTDATDMRVEGSVVHFDSLTLVTDGHSVGVAGSYDMERRVCDVRSWGRNLDLALVKEGLSLPFAVRGSGRFDTFVRGDIDNPQIDLVLEAHAGRIDSLTFDGLLFRGGFDATGYRVDELTVHTGVDSITIAGRWGFEDSPVRMVRRGFDRGAASGADVSVRARARTYPLASVFAALHQPTYWQGAFTGELTIEGTLGEPTAELVGSVTSRPGERYRLPPVATHLRYTNETVSVVSLSLDDGSTRGKADGELPVVMSLSRGVARKLTSPMRLRINLESNDLSDVAKYFQWLAVTEGQLSGRLEIRGPFGDPTYSGEARLREGVIRLTDMEEVYEEISADLSLMNATVTLQKIQGAVGKDGRFDGSGTATIENFRLKTYDLTLNFKDYTLRSTPDIVTTQDGSVRVASRENNVGDVVPNVTGAVLVTHGLITMRFGQHASAAIRPTEDPTWFCNIDIDAPKNVWVRNTDLNMELSGDLILRNDERGLYLLGDMSVLRGSYTLYNNKFHVTQGDIDFSGGARTRPVYHLSAYTPHRLTGESERRIFLDLSWPVDKKEPEITLSYSEPGYSEADLWRMLGGQVVAGDAGLGAGEFDAGGAAQNIASNYLERILNTRMQDTTIEMESRVREREGAAGGQREMSIAVGRYLSEDLYLKYRQGLTYATDQEVNVEYRVSRMIIVRSEIIRHARSGVPGTSRRQTSEEINFDIKLRWEF